MTTAERIASNRAIDARVAAKKAAEAPIVAERARLRYNRAMREALTGLFESLPASERAELAATLLRGVLAR